VSKPAYGYEGGGKTLAALGACFAHDLPAHKARLYAQLLLANAHKHADVASTLHRGFAQLLDETTGWG
jgi:L-asparaginase